MGHEAVSSDGAIGQLDFYLHSAPPWVCRCNRRVAVQVEFEKQALKPGYHFTGSRVETRRFRAVTQLDSARVQPPTVEVRGQLVDRLQEVGAVAA